VQEHTRYIEFTNAGTLPLKIRAITVDNHFCHDYWEVLKVTNCKELEDSIIEPKQTVILNLTYFESF
jgi:hypothetical protein